MSEIKTLSYNCTIVAPLESTNMDGYEQFPLPMQFEN